MFEDGTRYIWGAQTLPFAVPDWLASPISSEYFFLTLLVFVVFAAVIALFVILNWTRIGLRIRAGTLDLETVSALGVNVRPPA